MTRFRPSHALLSPRILVGGTLVLLLWATALLAPLLAPHDPAEQDLTNLLLPPFWVVGGDMSFPLGTDGLGRDILSRLIFGARVAAYVSLVASVLAMLIGGGLALLAGYLGGVVDWCIGRVVDVWMSFPPVILTLILLVSLGNGVNHVIIGIVLVGWTRFCRVVRSDVIVIARSDHVAAARQLGFGPIRIMLKEVLPLALPLVMTLLSLEMGIAIILEAVLSFTGNSVESDVAAWGVMIADGRANMTDDPWGLLFPGLAIFLSVLGFNFLGDGLRRALDPKLSAMRGLG